MNTKTYPKGYLAVGDGHQIYFETYGNPEGIPVLFLHGGPGLGFSEADRRFFNLQKYKLVLFDQRGAGRSQPLGSIAHNTTPHLLEDINQLLQHLNIVQPVLLFGGSWGSTLALLYGIRYPEKVRGMILRGVFTASLSDRDYFENGGVAEGYPKVWERYASNVPLEKRTAVAAYYFQQILSADPLQTRKFSYELIYYGLSLARRGITEEEVIAALEKVDFESKAILLAHYSQNNFFLPDEYIYNNLDKINDIPISLVHGKYDEVCPPRIAQQLYEQLANAKLYLVEAGHSPAELAIEQRLKMELELF